MEAVEVNRRGRKPGIKQIPLQILLPRETIEKLTAQAKKKGKPRARLVRELVDGYLQEAA